MVFMLAYVFPLLVFLKGSGYQPFSFSELTILFLLAIFVAIYSNVNKAALVHPVALLIIVFIALQAIFFVGSNSFTASASSLLLHSKYYLVTLLVPFVIVTNYDEKNLLLHFLIVGALVCLYGVVQLVFSHGVSLQSWIQSPRLTSIFPNPNMYAIYLVVHIFLLIAYRTTNIKRTRRIFISALLLLFVISLLLTFSRRGWILFGIGLVIIFFYSKYKRMAIFPFVVIVSILPIAVGDIGVDKIVYLFDVNHESVQYRLYEYEYLLNILTSNHISFLAGDGVGEYGPSSSFIVNDSNNVTLHSYILLIWLELGIVGLSIYILIYLLAAFYGMKKLKCLHGSDQVRQRELIYLVLLLITFLAGIVGMTPVSFPINLLQCMILGLVIRPVAPCVRIVVR